MLYHVISLSFNNNDDYYNLHMNFVSATFNKARKGTFKGEKGLPIDSNVETDYSQPRNRHLPHRFGHSSEESSSDNESPPKTSQAPKAGNKRKGDDVEYEPSGSEEDLNVSKKSKKKVATKSKSLPDPNENAVREQLARLRKQAEFKKKTSRETKTRVSVKVKGGQKPNSKSKTPPRCRSSQSTVANSEIVDHNSNSVNPEALVKRALFQAQDRNNGMYGIFILHVNALYFGLIFKHFSCCSSLLDLFQ